MGNSSLKDLKFMSLGLGIEFYSKNPELQYISKNSESGLIKVFLRKLIGSAASTFCKLFSPDVSQCMKTTTSTNFRFFFCEPKQECTLRQTSALTQTTTLTKTE